MNIIKAINELQENFISLMKKVNYKETANKIKGHAEAIDKAKTDIADLTEETGAVEDALCEVAEVGDGNNTNVEEALCDLAEAVENAVADIENALCELAEATEQEV